MQFYSTSLSNCRTALHIKRQPSWTVICQNSSLQWAQKLTILISEHQRQRGMWALHMEREQPKALKRKRTPESLAGHPQHAAVQTSHIRGHWRVFNWEQVPSSQPAEVPAHKQMRGNKEYWSLDLATVHKFCLQRHPLMSLQKTGAKRRFRKEGLW